MEFTEVLRGRRSIRSYQKKPIDAGDVQAVIDASVLAPSAINSQPWEFWVILGQERIEDLSRRAKAWLVEKVAHDPTAAAVHARLHLADPDLALLYHAPAIILIGTRSLGKQADEDCCLAALALLLGARNMGIGSCWIGSARPWFNQTSTKAELGIPETASVVAPIILGYPTEWPAGPARNPAIIHWIN